MYLLFQLYKNYFFVNKIQKNLYFCDTIFCVLSQSKTLTKLYHKNRNSTLFSFYSNSLNILSANTAYPILGSLIKTCVIAPQNFPFCIIGDPLIP